jgi:hypothetical protein
VFAVVREGQRAQKKNRHWEERNLLHVSPLMGA